MEIRRLSWLPPGPNGSQGGLHPAKTTSVVLSKSRGLKPSLSFCWYRQGQTEARCLGHQDQESHHGIQIQEAFDSTVASVCSHRSDPGVCSRVHLSIHLRCLQPMDKWGARLWFAECACLRLQPPASLPCSSLYVPGLCLCMQMSADGMRRCGKGWRTKGEKRWG